jgi:heme exporter protein B
LQITSTYSQLFSIIKKEFTIEWRQKNSLFGIVLYLLSLVFMIYNLQSEPEPLVWNSLIWLCVLFITINSVAKSFMAENKGRWMYYYTIHHPQILIGAKLIYNTIYMLVIGLINLGLFQFFIGFPAFNKPLFVAIFLIGTISFGLLFTFLSAIVSKVNSNTTLLAILGFPLVFPIILIVSDLSKSLFEPLLVKGWNQFFGSLIAMDFLIVGLSLILFPYLWKEN